MSSLQKTVNIRIFLSHRSWWGAASYRPAQVLPMVSGGVNETGPRGGWPHKVSLTELLSVTGFVSKGIFRTDSHLFLNVLDSSWIVSSLHSPPRSTRAQALWTLPRDPPLPPKSAALIVIPLLFLNRLVLSTIWSFPRFTFLFRLTFAGVRSRIRRT